MHRSYQPILPCGNKYLQQRWDETYYAEHKRKVQSAKSMVDTNSPQTYVHLNLKLKKLQLEEERLSIIERDNRLLVEKMSVIMRTKGKVDNKNSYEAKSLNKVKREQEILKIFRENQIIGDRLTRCEPQYRVEKWLEDWVTSEKYMDSIAKYPRGWYAMRCPEKASKGKKKAAKESAKVVKAKAGKDDNDGDRRSMQEMKTGKREDSHKDNTGSIRKGTGSKLQHKKEEKDEDKNHQKVGDKKKETQESKDNKKESGKGEDLTKNKEKDDKISLDGKETSYDDDAKEDESHKSQQSEREHETDAKEDADYGEQDPDAK